jgi:hypothetical protein
MLIVTVLIHKNRMSMLIITILIHKNSMPMLIVTSLKRIVTSLKRIVTSLKRIVTSLKRIVAWFIHNFAALNARFRVGKHSVNHATNNVNVVSRRARQSTKQKTGTINDCARLLFGDWDIYFFTIGK